MLLAPVGVRLEIVYFNSLLPRYLHRLSPLACFPRLPSAFDIPKLKLISSNFPRLLCFIFSVVQTCTSLGFQDPPFPSMSRGNLFISTLLSSLWAYKGMDIIRNGMGCMHLHQPAGDQIFAPHENAQGKWSIRAIEVIST